jgi:hypothetical protein
MCTLCKTTESDTQKRLAQIGEALKKKQITRAHADELINGALGIIETQRDRSAEATWERNYRKGRE